MNSKEYLEKLKKEIDKTNYSINNSKKVRVKMNLKRKFIKFLIALRFIYPAIITYGLTATTFGFLGNIPFYIDSKKEYLKEKKEIDNLNNVSYEYQYEEYENSENTISIFSTWKEAGNGLYERVIEIYNANSLNEEKLIEIVNNKTLINSVSELFEEKPIIRRERKNKLNENDMYEDSYMQATIYSEDENDFILVKESITEDIAVTLLWLSGSFIPDFGISELRNKIVKYDYKESFKNIDKKYRFNEDTIESLKKNLELKESNYNTLVRKL